ncbi:MAG: GntR family transcriptional regulator [Anaerolineales bacterium]|nr:GntR family transcriptional regulator [Anaerolineales bacterium]
MIENLPVQNPPLADQVYDIILKSILNGEYKPGSRLPSENELAELYKVSRPTIRTAFTRLGELGYVTKKRGVGTFVSNAPSISNPLYLSIDVMDRIAARGFKPGFRQLEAKIISADKNLSEKLDIHLNSKVLTVQKVFSADDEPIIFFENFIPEWVYQNYVTEDQVLESGATEPFFQFFANECKHEVKFLTSIIYPVLLKNCHLPIDFNIYEPITPVLAVEDLGYSHENTVLFLSKEHLFKDASQFYVIRQVGMV